MLSVKPISTVKTLVRSVAILLLIAFYHLIPLRLLLPSIMYFINGCFLCAVLDADMQSCMNAQNFSSVCCDIVAGWILSLNSIRLLSPSIIYLINNVVLYAEC